MSDLSKLFHQHEYKLKSLLFLKFEIEDYLKFPLETVSIDSLKYQYQFALLEIENLEFQIKNQFTTQSNSLKLYLSTVDLKLKKTQSSFTETLPTYSSIFK